jgi:hypothetical protein
MARNPAPLSLAQKVQAAAERIAAIDSRMHHLETVERPAALDALAQLEAQALGKAAGWEDVTLSGYITSNPYLPADHPSAHPAPLAAVEESEV